MLGLEATTDIRSDQMIGNDRVDTGIDVVAADQIDEFDEFDEFNDFLDSLGISG